MTAIISKNGDVEIEFYIVRTKEGAVSIWTELPPPNPDIERHGPFVAAAQVTKRLAPQS